MTRSMTPHRIIHLTLGLLMLCAAGCSSSFSKRLNRLELGMTQPQAKPVGEVVLSGPGSSQASLAESLGVHLGLPTSVAAPLGALDASALAGEDPHRFTVAAGLARGRAA